LLQVSRRDSAAEGRCFVNGACQVRDAPAARGREVATWPAERLLVDGGRVIVGALGEVLAEPLVGERGLLCAEVDTDELVRARYDFDVVGHYARPDVFELSVDERPRPGVRFVGSSSAGE
ncbi:carbon-nitrogen hydrolase family protein, partial [Pseudomonas soli]|nr:carbon-nitrogen hydrolase family protein [Pseudomonas soli]